MSEKESITTSLTLLGRPRGAPGSRLQRDRRLG